MSSSQTKKVLMVVTSESVVPNSDVKTGFHLSELTHPYYEVTSAGFAVDIASIKGGKAPLDPHSDPREPDNDNPDDIIGMGFLSLPRHRAKIENTVRLADADLNDYDAIFFAGGAGAIFDFPENEAVTNAVRTMWESDKIVSTICHGGSALLGVKLSSGDYLVRDKEITALSAAEEDFIHKTVPAFQTPVYMETEFPKAGAIFRQGGFHQPFALTSSGRLITGQNPQSATLAGRLLAQALSGNKV